jgi:hypothetical protein
VVETMEEEKFSVDDEAFRENDVIEGLDGKQMDGPVADERVIFRKPPEQALRAMRNIDHAGDTRY